MLKQKRRATAKGQLAQWTSDRKKQIEMKKVSNKQEEKASDQEKKRLKDTTNPWERVIANVEIQQS